MNSALLKDEQPNETEKNALSLEVLKDLKKSFFSEDLNFLSPYLKVHSNLLVFSFICFALSLILSLFIPKLMGAIVDVGLEKRSQFHSLFIFYISLTLLKIIFEIAYKLIFTKIGAQIITQIRRNVYDILLNLPMTFFDKNSSGRIISRTVSDINNLATFFNANFFTIIADVFFIFGSLLMLFSISPVLAIIICFIVMILFVNMLNINFNLGIISKKFRSYKSRLNNCVSDTLNNISTVSSHNYQSKLFTRFQKINYLAGKNNDRRLIIWAKFVSTHAIALGFSFSLIIWFCAYEIEAGKMGPGGLITSLTYMGMIFYPFFEISEKFNVMVVALSSVHKIKEIFSVEREISFQYGTNTNDLLLRETPIEFNRVHFSYTDKIKLYENLNLKIEPKKITALIGRTGSGKTTLTNLILRLYQIQSGEIVWGNKNIFDYDSSVFAKNVGVVTQELFLFEDTIRENLRIYDLAITDSMMWAILEDIGLSECVKRLKNGLDEIYERKGEFFSTGEKQLLIIARMLLKDPALLIFDEATSNLDNESEYKVQVALKKLFKNRTTILIAHRKSTLNISDNYIEFAHGKILKHDIYNKREEHICD